MASLEHILINIKSREREIFFVVSIILVGLIGFGLGRISKLDDNKVPITIRESASVVNSAVSTAPGKLVASKSGTSYHFPWCSGAKKISEANKVWFASVYEAEKAGYKKATNCKGL
ncbi:MAG: hypothetical protein AAB965_03440 [Patescibacteria group bacterium]